MTELLKHELSIPVGKSDILILTFIINCNRSLIFLFILFPLFQLNYFNISESTYFICQIQTEIKASILSATMDPQGVTARLYGKQSRCTASFPFEKREHERSKQFLYVFAKPALRQKLNTDSSEIFPSPMKLSLNK